MMRQKLIGGTDGGECLYLLPPRIRYATYPPSAQSAPHGSWEQGGDESEWVYSDGSLKLCACLRPGPMPGANQTRMLSLRVTSVKPVRVGLCSVELMAPSPQPPYYLDRSLRWRALHGSASLNDYSPLVVRWRAGTAAAAKMEVRTLRGFVSCKLLWKQQRLRLTINLDAAALHPRWQLADGSQVSTAAPDWDPGKSISVNLLLSRATGAIASPPLVVARFPGGAEASITLTDHSDFDTTEQLETFMHGDGKENGWLGRGLRLTKGVFTLATLPPNRTKAASLQDERYRELIWQLYKEGSEIAPHALNESGNISPNAYASALREFALQWSPRTWIDHGSTLHYCYTMGGGDNPEYKLLDELKQNGFNVLWSYHDTPTDAAGSLNLLAPPVSDLGSITGRIISHLSRGRVHVALHYLRSSIHWHLRGPVGYLATQTMSSLRRLGLHSLQARRISRSDLSQTWNEMKRSLLKVNEKGLSAFREPYTRDELLDMAPIVYPERAVPLSQVDGDELVLFTTGEALHTSDIYTGRALHHLLDERGLHIGHCYLLNEIPYIAGVFQKRAGAPRLTPEWSRFIDLLSELVRCGRVWNPTMADLASWIRATQHIECIPTSETSLRITNTLPRPVCGFTLLMPPTISPGNIAWSDSAPGGWRYWEDWLAVWGDLPGNSQITVRWDADPVTQGSGSRPGAR